MPAPLWWQRGLLELIGGHSSRGRPASLFGLTRRPAGSGGARTTPLGNSPVGALVLVSPEEAEIVALQAAAPAWTPDPLNETGCVVLQCGALLWVLTTPNAAGIDLPLAAAPIWEPSMPNAVVTGVSEAAAPLWVQFPPKRSWVWFARGSRFCCSAVCCLTPLLGGLRWDGLLHNVRPRMGSHHQRKKRKGAQMWKTKESTRKVSKKTCDKTAKQAVPLIVLALFHFCSWLPLTPVLRSAFRIGSESLVRVGAVVTRPAAEVDADCSSHDGCPGRCSSGPTGLLRPRIMVALSAQRARRRDDRFSPAAQTDTQWHDIAVVPVEAKEVGDGRTAYVMSSGSPFGQGWTSHWGPAELWTRNVAVLSVVQGGSGWAIQDPVMWH